MSEKAGEGERDAGARACQCAIVKVQSLARSHMPVCMCSHEFVIRHASPVSTFTV